MNANQPPFGGPPNAGYPAQPHGVEPTPGAAVNQLTGIRLDPVSQQANLKTHLCRLVPMP